MGYATTDDCKKYLLTLHAHTETRDWKRTRKYKHTNGMILRDFEASSFGLKEIIIEGNNGLMRLSDYLNGMPYTNTGHKDAYNDFINKLGINSHLFGGGAKDNTNKADDLAKFLNVLEHGIDWEAPEFSRSAFDYSNELDFNQIVQTHPQLLQDIVRYTNYIVNFIQELDETYMPHHCSRSNFDDSVPDLINLISRIKQAYVENNMSLDVHKSDVIDIIGTMNEIRTMMDEEPAMINKAKRAMKDMKTLLLSLNAI